MKKPHETTLTVMQFDKERRCLVEEGQRMVAVMRNYEAAGWEAMLTAAPAMARLLLERVEECGSCGGSGTLGGHECASPSSRASPSRSDMLARWNAFKALYVARASSEWREKLQRE